MRRRALMCWRWRRGGLLQEMSDFIDRFPATREKELADQKRTEDMVRARERAACAWVEWRARDVHAARSRTPQVLSLLEHISTGIGRQHTMPTYVAAADDDDNAAAAGSVYIVRGLIIVVA